MEVPPRHPRQPSQTVPAVWQQVLWKAAWSFSTLFRSQLIAWKAPPSSSTWRKRLARQPCLHPLRRTWPPNLRNRWTPFRLCFILFLIFPHLSISIRTYNYQVYHSISKDSHTIGTWPRIVSNFNHSNPSVPARANSCRHWNCNDLQRSRWSHDVTRCRHDFGRFPDA